jgi:restriction system protein
MIVLRYIELFVYIGVALLLFSILYKVIPLIIEKYKYKNSNLYDIDSMTGPEFERYLVNKYQEKGYNVQHVGGSGDYGADLILTKNRERIIIQAKRYNSSVGVKAVQEVISAREFFHGSQAAVITNNYFTKNAITMAKQCNVILLDRDELFKL